MPSYTTKRGNTIRWGKMSVADELEAYAKMTPKVVLRQKEQSRRQPAKPMTPGNKPK